MTQPTLRKRQAESGAFSRARKSFANDGSTAEGKDQMIKPKRTAEQQIEDEADRRALNPILSRQTIAESQAAPEFQENLKRLKAERLAREAGAKTK